MPSNRSVPRSSAFPFRSLRVRVSPSLLLVMLLALPILLSGALLPFYMHPAPISVTEAAKNKDLADFTTQIPVCTADGIVYVSLEDFNKLPKARAPHCPMCVLSSLALNLCPPAENPLTFRYPDHSEPVFFVETTAPIYRLIAHLPAPARAPPAQA